MPNPCLPRGAFARLGFVAAIGLAMAYVAIGPRFAHADEAPPVQCVQADHMRDSAEAEGGKWIELTDLQHAFLAGIYAMNPTTPPGLPVGDRAALATLGDHGGGVVFFLDGDKACAPMPVPDELLEMLRHVGAGDVTHAGDRKSVV